MIMGGGKISYLCSAISNCYLGLVRKRFFSLGYRWYDVSLLIHVLFDMYRYAYGSLILWRFDIF